MPISIKGRDRLVFPMPGGKWGNKRNDGKMKSNVHKTQELAIKAAKRMLRKEGGGELLVMACLLTTND